MTKHITKLPNVIASAWLWGVGSCFLPIVTKPLPPRQQSSGLLLMRLIHLGSPWQRFAVTRAALCNSLGRCIRNTLQGHLWCRSGSGFRCFIKKVKMSVKSNNKITNYTATCYDTCRGKAEWNANEHVKVNEWAKRLFLCITQQVRPYPPFTRRDCSADLLRSSSGYHCFCSDPPGEGLRLQLWRNLIAFLTTKSRNAAAPAPASQFVSGIFLRHLKYRLQPSAFLSISERETRATVHPRHIL